MKKISTRQIIIFYIIYSYAIKFLMLPHYLCQNGKDGWITAAIGGAVELALLFITLQALRLQQNKDIYSHLKDKLSAIGAKAILAVLFAFFLLQTLISVIQSEYLIHETLYENLNFNTFMLPLLVFGIFFCYAKTRAIFRASELVFILLVAAISLALLPAVNRIDIREILPVFEKGASPIFSALFKNLVYFESSIVLLMFMGAISPRLAEKDKNTKKSKITKHFTRNFMLCATASVIIFTAFVFFYQSIFGPLVNIRPISIVNITQESSYISQNGRLEWIMICVWLVLLLMRFGVTFYCCFAALRYIIPANPAQPAALALPLALLVYIIQSLTKVTTLLPHLQIAIAAFYVLIPLLILATNIRRQRK